MRRLAVLAAALLSSASVSASPLQTGLPTPNSTCTSVMSYLVTETNVQFVCVKIVAATGAMQVTGRFSFARSGNDPWLEMVRNAKRQGKVLGIHLASGKLTGITE